MVAKQRTKLADWPCSSSGGWSPLSEKIGLDCGYYLPFLPCNIIIGPLVQSWGKAMRHLDGDSWLKICAPVLQTNVRLSPMSSLGAVLEGVS